MDRDTTLQSKRNTKKENIMKTTTTIMVLLFLLIGSPTAQAQDLLDALKQTAQMYNEANPEGESETNQGAAPEGQNEWQEAWDNEREENADILDALDTKYLKCTALMILYVDAYIRLKEEHKIGNVSMSACDAYGMQTLALAASTTIMYCPEEMVQLSIDELKKIAIDLDKASQEYSRGNTNLKLWLKFLNIANWYYHGEAIQELGQNNTWGDSPDHLAYTIKYMISFFTPRHILGATLKIAEKMEALSCSG